jgi:uncharacterized protein YdcH (DUF465 family)
MMSEHYTRWMVDNMKAERVKLKQELYHTPRWRKIKRYRLFEKIEKLDGDISLIVHVMLDDDEDM